MIELIEFPDCLKLVWDSGSWKVVTPHQDGFALTELPADLTEEQIVEALAILGRCEGRLAVAVAEANAENEVFAAEVAKVEAEEDGKRSAEIRRQLIAAGVIKP